MNIKLRYSTPYNPTGNGIVERRNSIIKTIFGLYPGSTIPNIIKLAESRLNDIFCQGTGFSPTMTHYGNSVFDINEITKHELVKMRAINNIKRFSKLNNFKINKQRKKHEYKQGDLVFTKNHSKKELDYPYLGPYTIKIVDPKGNRVCLKQNNRYVWVNIKYIKPFFPEEGQHCDISQ